MQRDGLGQTVNGAGIGQRRRTTRMTKNSLRKSVGNCSSTQGLHDSHLWGRQSFYTRRSPTLSTQVQACNLVADLADRDHYVGLLLYKCKQEMKPQMQCFLHEDEVRLSATRAHTTLLSVSEVAPLNDVVKQYVMIRGRTLKRSKICWHEIVMPQLKRFIL